MQRFVELDLGWIEEGPLRCSRLRKLKLVALVRPWENSTYVLFRRVNFRTRIWRLIRAFCDRFEWDSGQTSEICGDWDMTVFGVKMIKSEHGQSLVQVMISVAITGIVALVFTIRN